MALLAGALLPAARVQACVAPTAAATAEWVYRHNVDLDPPKERVRAALSPELFGLLEKEHACVVRTQEVCALDADLWTETQEGQIIGPVTFRETGRIARWTTVLMEYRFALREDGEHDQPRTTSIRMVRGAGKTCWTVDDIIGPDGTSLKKLLLQNP